MRFVQEHGSWTDGNRVSTPFLVTRLEAKKLTGDLLAYVRGRLTAFNPNAGGSISLSHIDACLDELRPLVVTEHEERELREVQHLALLYRYRKHLVHEFREPGYGMEVFAEDGDEPCYHGYAKDPRFYLVYPVGLFQSLADSAITQIEAYFAARNLDPYERVGDTSRW